jgi:Domain of unknown function (DUF4188)
MAAPIYQRMTVDIEGDFVIFLIGLQIHQYWKIRQWFGVVMSMPKMLKELSNKPKSGFLGYEGRFGTIVQYWRSFEQLEAYAKDRSGLHYPVWKEFNTKVKKSNSIGIWHETYLVRRGDYECIYHNMPPYGLGKIGKLIPASGKLELAGGRIKAKAQE